MTQGPDADGNRPVLVPLARLALNSLLIAAGIALIAWVCVQLRLVVVPLLAALLAAALLLPVVDELRRRRVPSVAASLATLFGLAVLLAGAIALIAPPVADQFDNVGREAREGFERALQWLTQGPFGLEREDIERAIDQAGDRLRESSGPLTRGIVGGATLLAEIVAGLLLWVLLLFFFLHDGRRMWRWVVGLLPERHRADAEAVGRCAWAALSGYVRGVVVIAFVDAVLIGIALWIIGVPLVLPLAVLTFLGAFVPLVGAVTAGAVAALVALVSAGVVPALIVVAVITAIQQLEGDLLYPLIVGNAIDMHPVAVLLVLTAGTVVAGIAGAVLAVPVAAAIWSGIDYLRRQSAET